MRYSLGIALGPSTLSWALATSIVSVEGAPVTWPAVLFIDGDTVVAGAEAVVRGEVQPQNLVQDVIGRFTLDQLWLSGNRILTADDVMAELLGAVTLAARNAMGDAATAIAVSCPVAWDEGTCQRLADLLGRVSTASTQITRDKDAVEAAQLAAASLPEEAARSDDQISMPLAASAFEKPRREQVPEHEFEPQRHSRRRSRLLEVGTVVGVILVVGTVVILVVTRSGHHHPSTVSSSTPNTSSSSSPTQTSATPPLSTLRIGVISSGFDGAVEQAVNDINAAGGVLGRPVQLVSADLSSGAGSAANQLAGQQVGAVVLDVPGADADEALNVLAPSAVPACVTAAPSAPVPNGSTVAQGTAEVCTELLALAASFSGSSAPADVAAAVKALGGGGGVGCGTFTQCEQYVQAQQTITLEATGSGQPAVKLLS